MSARLLLIPLILLVICCQSAPLPAPALISAQRAESPRPLLDGASWQHALSDLERLGHGAQSATLNATFVNALASDGQRDASQAHERYALEWAQRELSAQAYESWLAEYQRVRASGEPERALLATGVLEARLVKRALIGEALSEVRYLDEVTDALLAPVSTTRAERRALFMGTSQRRIAQMLALAQEELRLSDREGAARWLALVDQELEGIDEAALRHRLRGEWVDAMAAAGGREALLHYFSRVLVAAREREQPWEMRVAALSQGCEVARTLEALEEATSLCEAALQAHPPSRKPSYLLSYRLAEIALARGELAQSARALPAIDALEARYALGRRLLEAMLTAGELDQAQQLAGEALSELEEARVEVIVLREKLMVLAAQKRSATLDEERAALMARLEALDAEWRGFDADLPLEPQLDVLMELVRTRAQIKGLTPFTLESIVALLERSERFETQVNGNMELARRLDAESALARRLVTGTLTQIAVRQDRKGRPFIEEIDVALLARVLDRFSQRDELFALVVEQISGEGNLERVLSEATPRPLSLEAQRRLVSQMTRESVDGEERLRGARALMPWVSDRAELDRLEGALLIVEDPKQYEMLRDVHAALFTRRLALGASVSGLIAHVQELKVGHLEPLLAVALLDALTRQAQRPGDMTLAHARQLQQWMERGTSVVSARDAARLAALFASFGECEAIEQVPLEVLASFPLGLPEQVYHCRDAIPPGLLLDWLRTTDDARHRALRTMVWAMLYD